MSKSIRLVNKRFLIILLSIIAVTGLVIMGYYSWTNRSEPKAEEESSVSTPSEVADLAKKYGWRINALITGTSGAFGNEYEITFTNERGITESFSQTELSGMIGVNDFSKDGRFVNFGSEVFDLMTGKIFNLDTWCVSHLFFWTEQNRLITYKESEGGNDNTEVCVVSPWSGGEKTRYVKFQMDWDNSASAGRLVGDFSYRDGKFYIYRLTPGNNDFREVGSGCSVYEGSQVSESGTESVGGELVPDKIVLNLIQAVPDAIRMNEEGIFNCKIITVNGVGLRLGR